MNCFQIFWTVPFSGRTLGGIQREENSSKKLEEFFADYYLLTMILSALQWKKMNKGKIKLYTDSNFMEYLTKYELLDIWDSYDTEIFLKINGNFDYSTFSSVGKFYAYLNEKAPCVAVDVDLILWEDINDRVKDIEVGFTHWEDTELSYWYPQKEKICRPEGYDFNPDWDWTLRAANTALIYFKNDEFKNYYAREVIRYMKNNYVGGKFNTGKPELLFAEQRLLLMCAKEKNILDKTKPFLDATWNPGKGSFITNDPKHGEWFFDEVCDKQFATHLWMKKVDIENDNERRKICCNNLLDKIFSLAPELEVRLKKIQCLKKTIDEYRK